MQLPQNSLAHACAGVIPAQLVLVLLALPPTLSPALSPALASALPSGIRFALHPLTEPLGAVAKVSTVSQAPCAPPAAEHCTRAL